MRELIVSSYPKSSITEAIKSIKTNLRFSTINKETKKILITSSVEGEGKSFLSANLASTFTSNTGKVLLIDCDLRRGRQQNLFELPSSNSLGLSNLLIDSNWQKNLQKYLHKTTIENLDILPTGTIPPNPTTLLESEKLDQVISELEKKYDTIIFDTPPVLGLSDTLILSRLADIVLIVTRARKTTMELLESTVSALKTVNANIGGIILNRIKIGNNKYYKN